MEIGVEERLGIDWVLNELLAIDDARLPWPFDSIPAELRFPSETWLEDVVLPYFDREILDASASLPRSFLAMEPDGDTGGFEDLFPEFDVADE